MLLLICCQRGTSLYRWWWFFIHKDFPPSFFLSSSSSSMNCIYWLKRLLHIQVLFKERKERKQESWSQWKKRDGVFVIDTSFCVRLDEAFIIIMDWRRYNIYLGIERGGGGFEKMLYFLSMNCSLLSPFISPFRYIWDTPSLANPLLHTYAQKSLSLFYNQKSVR